MSPPVELFCLDGWWLACCPGCGHQLARSRSQHRAEQRARRRRCPTCPPPAARSRHGS